jgi:hypothetical protein
MISSKTTKNGGLEKTLFFARFFNKQYINNRTVVCYSYNQQQSTQKRTIVGNFLIILHRHDSKERTGTRRRGILL